MPLRAVARTRIGWAMAVTFGLQSAQAYTIFGWFAQLYRDAGFSATTAGLLLGVITGVSIPVSLWVPSAAAQTRGPDTADPAAASRATPSATSGCCSSPSAAPGCGRVLVGVGTGVFPLVLTMIGLRSRTSDGTAALSGFTQAVGYAVSISVRSASASLTTPPVGGRWPLLSLTVLSLVTGWLATIAGRPQFIEDELGAPPRRTRAGPGRSRRS